MLHGTIMGTVMIPYDIHGAIMIPYVLHGTIMSTHSIYITSSRVQDVHAMITIMIHGTIMSTGSNMPCLGYPFWWVHHTFRVSTWYHHDPCTKHRIHMVFHRYSMDSYMPCLGYPFGVS